MEICDKRAGWINVGGPERAVAAHASLASVLRYTGAALVERACVSVAVGRDKVGADWHIVDEAIRARIGAVVRELLGA